jgi:hypothetical protein
MDLAVAVVLVVAVMETQAELVRQVLVVLEL